jgi:hypothetical protein
LQVVSDVATTMYCTGLDPFTMKEVYIAKQMRDRKFQRTLLQSFKPENYFEVREALSEGGRTDLIGDGSDSLISSRPPEQAIMARRKRANAADHYHTVADPAPGEPPGEKGLPNYGDRPDRKNARRQDRRRKGGGR